MLFAYYERTTIAQLILAMSIVQFIDLLHDYLHLSPE